MATVYTLVGSYDLISDIILLPQKTYDQFIYIHYSPTCSIQNIVKIRSNEEVKTLPIYKISKKVQPTFTKKGLIKEIINFKYISIGLDKERLFLPSAGASNVKFINLRLYYFLLLFIQVVIVKLANVRLWLK